MRQRRVRKAQRGREPPLSLNGLSSGEPPDVHSICRHDAQSARPHEPQQFGELLHVGSQSHQLTSDYELATAGAHVLKELGERRPALNEFGASAASVCDNGCALQWESHLLGGSAAQRELVFETSAEGGASEECDTVYCGSSSVCDCTGLV